MSQKLKKLMIAMGVIVILGVVIALIVFFVGNKSLSYVQIENKMIAAAKEYLSDEESLLPLNDDDEVEIGSDILVQQGYMKELSKYQKNKDVSCTGSVYVTKSGSYYNYAPYLACGDQYMTKYLYEEVTSTVVSEEDGLYKTDQYFKDGEQNSVYIFRGDYVNNFVKIDKQLWRIVKVDQNYNITLIQESVNKNTDYRGAWDDRYNTQADSDAGINNYFRSVLRNKILDYYNSDNLSDDIKAKLVSTPLCIGTRSEKDKGKDGSIECRETLEGEYLSILTAYDFMNASLDNQCQTIVDKSCGNYNYLTDYDRTFWLITTDKDESFKGYKAATEVSKGRLSTNGSARIVLTLTKNTIYGGGNGTADDPYLIN